MDESHPQSDLIKKDVARSRNGQVKELFKSGFGIHHAGMLRSDRNLVEKLFAEGHITVLCCTATLAWGVNLPAHTVIIKGTQVCPVLLQLHQGVLLEQRRLLWVYHHSFFCIGHHPTTAISVCTTRSIEQTLT